MIGLDTNVLVRYLTQDDTRQASAAARLLENELSADTPGYVCAVVLAELVWVLSAAYAATREEIADTVEGLLGAPSLAFEHKAEVWQALRSYRAAKADFSDCLVAQVARAAGCTRIATFDRTAARVEGFALLQ